MDLLQKSCIVLAVFVCIFSLLFIPKEMGYLYMVADNRLIYIDERGSIERIYNLDQLYSIDYAEKNENWTLCFSDGKSWTISHDGIINAVKQVTGIEETIVE